MTVGNVSPLELELQAFSFSSIKLKDHTVAPRLLPVLKCCGSTFHISICPLLEYLQKLLMYFRVNYCVRNFPWPFPTRTLTLWSLGSRRAKYLRHHKFQNLLLASTFCCRESKKKKKSWIVLLVLPASQLLTFLSGKDTSLVPKHIFEENVFLQ